LITNEEILKMTRSQVRYHLYRIRTAEEGGVPHNAEAIKEFFENQKGCTKWIDFARVWDIDEEGKHYRIIRRSMTEEEEWLEQLKELAEELPWQVK